MVHSGKDRLRELLDELIWFPSNDPLVDTEHHHVLPIDIAILNRSIPFEGTIKKIIQKAVETQKESGSFPLCLAQGSLQWVINEKSVTSPLWLSPLSITRDRVKQTISFQYDPDLSFINPFIPLHLKRQFELDFPEEINELNGCVEWLMTIGMRYLTVDSYAIGNFHHHRFALVKELETLVSLPDSPLVNQLVGESINELTVESIKVNPLFPLDNDQLHAVRRASKENLVIQGPPGTGKSHVLATLLANVLAEGKNALVISEKRVALEVLQKKLAQFELDQYAFIASSTTVSKDFISELKESWKRLENKTINNLPAQLRLSEQLIDQLQLQLDTINQPGIAGGVDYSIFKSLEPKDLTKASYFSQLPDLSEWQRWETLVSELYGRSLAKTVGRLKRTLLASSTFFNLDILVRQWKEEWLDLNDLFGIVTWIDLQRAMKKAAVCQVLSQATFKQFEAVLLPGSATQKKFKRLKSGYFKASRIEEEAREKCITWKVSPSPLECDFLLQHAELNGFWQKIQFKKAWSKFTHLPVSYAKLAVSNQLDWIKAKQERDSIELKLSDLGITNPPVDLVEIEQMERTISSADWSEWQQLSDSERQIFAEKNSQLNGLYSSLHGNLQLQEGTDLASLLNHLLVHFPDLIGFREELLQLPENLVTAFLSFDTVEELFTAVYKRTVIQLSNLFPQLNEFTERGLYEKCLRIHQLQEDEGLLFSAHIHARQLQRFNEYASLLTSSTTKLSAEKKELKKRLKNGKSILVKVFAKTRNLPTIRELLTSDARLWINLLKPLWLSNPTQVAANIPLEPGCFSLTLIDEASQLALCDAIGCVYRSSHIIIAGDSQQMGPSAFFRKSGDQIDVLHQASFYWPSVHLRHHYRSEDPRLIAFSNRYFYANELIAFPSAHVNRIPIDLHYCPEGRYIDRQNEVEAMEVATHVIKALTENKSIGVVAFSATQLAAIERHLPIESLNKLEELIETGRGFFKPLEHVQGEECDELIVSLGYGKNDDEAFHMRFGPLNQANGHKRLNVLFTRAKKSIVLFTSIQSSDFKLSENESVGLLKNYLFMAEQGLETSKMDLLLPFELRPEQEGNVLRFKHIYQEVPNAQELVTLVNVLEQRGWRLEFGTV